MFFPFTVRAGHLNKETLATYTVECRALSIIEASNNRQGQDPWTPGPLNALDSSQIPSLQTSSRHLLTLYPLLSNTTVYRHLWVRRKPQRDRVSMMALQSNGHDITEKRSGCCVQRSQPFDRVHPHDIRIQMRCSNTTAVTLWNHNRHYVQSSGVQFNSQSTHISSCVGAA
jgi:hypothetical protein